MFNKTRYDEAMQIYVDVLIASDSEISQKESSDEVNSIEFALTEYMYEL